MKKISLATLIAFATLSATLSPLSWANDTATPESGSKAEPHGKFGKPVRR